MRIVGREEFLALPMGTVFHSYRPQVMGPLSVKMSEPGRFENDWYEWEPGDPQSSGSSETTERLDAMEADRQIRYPLSMAYGRDGMFEPDALFVVYGDADVLALVAGLLGARQVGIDP